MARQKIFVTGATGYIGRALIPVLIQHGHAVTALSRPGSEHKLPPGCDVVVGDALDRTTFQHRVAPADTFVHLVGVPHPSPSKAREFERVDLASIRESSFAAGRSGVRHFVYLSVAQPAPIMRAYQSVRAQGERMIRCQQMSATMLRPWYVLGPGHHWPTVLRPFYWLAERVPMLREGARRTGLVTLEQMVRALVNAIETPPAGIRIWDVPAIREHSTAHAVAPVLDNRSAVLA